MSSMFMAYLPVTVHMLPRDTCMAWVSSCLSRVFLPFHPHIFDASVVKGADTTLGLDIVKPYALHI